MQRIGPSQRWSTRLAFLAAGLGMSAWAPLVPFARTRLALQEGELGLLLLCLGAGSLLAMPVTGILAARLGCRKVILWAGALACVVLPLLAVADSALSLGLAVFVFGAAIGTLDVAMNVQAVIVEKASGGALMSSFHGLFSVGGFIGAGLMALLLWAGASPLQASIAIAVLVAGALAGAAPFLLREPDHNHASGTKQGYTMPPGAVLLLGALCFMTFLAEGAMLDWSALLLTDGHGLAPDRAGLGYAAFAVAMTAGRLTGDRVVRRFGGARVMLAGGVCAAAGFFGAVAAPSALAALLGFALIGLGASNIVPVLFSAAGNQPTMSPSLAIGAITTLGYAGILAGPALIGFIAHAASLNLAFIGLGCAMLLVAASFNLVQKR